MDTNLRISRGIIKKGEKFNKWTALGETRIKYTKRSSYKESLFQCDCGTLRWHKDSNVKQGRTKMCQSCNWYVGKYDHLTPEQLKRKHYVDRLWPDK
jgi:hypothetical protein